MSERRATVILLQHGDPELSGAIAEGILAARAGMGMGATSSVSGKPLPPSTEEGGFWEPEVTVSPDRQRIVRALVRVAVGNTKTDEDYAQMTTRARGLYGAPARRGRLRRLGDRLLTGYALLCYAIGEAHAAQRHVLGRR